MKSFRDFSTVVALYQEGSELDAVKSKAQFLEHSSNSEQIDDRVDASQAHS